MTDFFLFVFSARVIIVHCGLSRASKIKKSKQIIDIIFFLTTYIQADIPYTVGYHLCYNGAIITYLLHGAESFLSS